MANRVVIGDNAFIQLFLSATAVIDRETNGVLVGGISENAGVKTYNVNIAHPYQTAKTTKSSTQIDSAENERLEFILEHLGSKRAIGSFHSHPFYNRKFFLGGDDEETMRGEYSEGAELVINVSPTQGLLPLKVSAFRITGSFRLEGEAYRMALGAYSLNIRHNGEIGSKRRAAIRIPKRTLKNYFH